MAFGILFAQTKSTDDTPDLILWLIAIAIPIAALLLGWLKKGDLETPNSAWPPGPISLITISVQVVICGGVLMDVFRHLHSS
jgi:hypothetical protein